MINTKKRASMLQVVEDIKPYITKKFMSAPSIKESDIPDICRILLSRYKNVSFLQGLTNSKPVFQIRVKGLLAVEEKAFEVTSSNRKKAASKKKDDLSWVDRLEEMDAVLDDF